MSAQNGAGQPGHAVLNEATWQKWLAKGRTREARARHRRDTAVKWISTAGLVAAALLWSRVPPYEVALRFIVAVGSIAAMVQSLYLRQYPFAAVFAAVALLFNPVAPVFEFSGDWQHALVIASTIPFVVSLVLRKQRTPVL